VAFLRLRYDCAIVVTAKDTKIAQVDRRA